MEELCRRIRRPFLCVKISLTFGCLTEIKTFMYIFYMFILQAQKLCMRILRRGCKCGGGGDYKSAADIMARDAHGETGRCL